MLILLQQSQSDEKEKIMKQIVARIIGNLSETISKIRVFAGELKKRRPHGWEGGEGAEGGELEYPEIEEGQFDGLVVQFFSLSTPPPPHTFPPVTSAVELPSSSNNQSLTLPFYMLFVGLPLLFILPNL